MTVHFADALISMNVQKDFTTVQLVRSVSTDSIRLAASQFVSVDSFLVGPIAAAWVS